MVLNLGLRMPFPLVDSSAFARTPSYAPLSTAETTSDGQRLPDVENNKSSIMTSTTSRDQPSLTAPVFEHHHNGLGIEATHPRISWRFLASESTILSWTQSAYEIEVTPEDTKTSTLYHVESLNSVLVPWPADALQSRSSATVRVRSFGSAPGEAVQPTSWSNASTIEAALLDEKDWTASLITAAEPLQTRDQPLRPFWLKKQFTIDAADIHKSRLYITALGVFDAYINGHPVSNDCMVPGWTSYHHRLVYRVYDVTPLLQNDAPNVICVELGEGWYAGRMGFRGGKRFNYGGEEVGLLAQLEVHSGPGTTPWTLSTDKTWTCIPSARQYSEIYNGELYDMREEPKDLHEIQKVDEIAQPWMKARILDARCGRLSSPDAPPVRVVETVQPAQILRSPSSGNIIIDFGQNLAGKLQINSLTAPKDHVVSFHHAEVLEHGELGTRPLRSAKARDTIISSGKPLKDWTPAFTFHGFRYVEVTGWEPSLNDITALVIRSDMLPRGTFTSSNKSLNQLHSNILWSAKSNFLSVPADCPSRDERMGWTGDLAIFAPTAAYLFDTTSFITSWLTDLMSEQLEPGAGGIPPLVSPNVMPEMWNHRPQGIWDDATILIPYTLYTWTHDKSILSRQFPSMQAWLDHGVDRDTDGLWNPTPFQFADWLDPSAPPNDMAASSTDPTLVVNAYLVHVTDLMSRICSILEKHSLAKKYAQDYTRLKALFHHKYITPSGNLMCHTPTAISLAISFNLYPSSSPSHLSTAATALSTLVRRAKFRIRTGFVGTSVILPALTTLSHTQLAYRMLLEPGYPSWMYPISKGATTIWERWDSMTEDGSVNPGQMTSFNHYALGAVGEWLYSTVGGISPGKGKDGWKRFLVKPVPGGNLKWVKVGVEGVYGRVECEWWVGGEVFEMRVIVPPNSRAVVGLPDGRVEEEVGSGVHWWRCGWVDEGWPPSGLYAPWQVEDERVVE